jgi:lambda family phage portal protein
MNILDRTISFFSPETAARRAYYRAVISHAERQFDGAKTTRLTANWRATGTSANAETSIGLDRLRWRARDFERNNDKAAGILRKLPAYMVGAGITLRPPSDLDAGAKARMKKNWSDFVRSSDIATRTNYNAQMNLAARTIARDGEVLLSWQDTPDPARPLALHVLEPDYLDSAKNAELANGHVVIQGVQFDQNGSRVGYWMFDQHPGEPVPIRKTTVSKFVSADRIDHIFDILRPGQARGIPWVAPVMLRMRDVAEYEQAELIRKKIEACYSVFITRADTEGVVPAGPNPQTTDPVTGEKIDTLKPGMIQRLAIGEQVSFGEPRQSVAVTDYLRSNWLSITFGIGVPYSVGTGDLSNANYGSQRAGLLDFWQLLDHWQWDMLIAMAYSKAWQRVHQAFARLGQGPREFPDAQYAPPKREWIDPEKDGRAEALALRIGKRTWPQMISQDGEDPDEQAAEISKWKPILDPLDLDYSANGASASAGAGAGGEADNPGNNDGENSGATPPARKPAAEADRLAPLAAELRDMRQAVTALLTREQAAPVVNVAAPVVNLNPSIAVQERADGARTLIVQRDADNRIQSVRAEPVTIARPRARAKANGAHT